MSQVLKLGVVVLTASLLLGGCNGSGEEQSSITPPVKELDLSPKTQLVQGSTFTFQYPLQEGQLLRIVEPAAIGTAFVNNNVFYYTADADKTGSDTVKLELVSNDNVLSITWLLRVNETVPRFTHVEVQDEVNEKGWRCIEDRQTHQGIMWLTSTKPLENTYSWGDWQAILPGFDAVCDDSLASCTTQSLVGRANEHQWCGKDNWRLPYAYEMKNITTENNFSLENNKPAADPFFFPSIGFESYWLATENIQNQSDNVADSYDFGLHRRQIVSENKRKPRSVMLVSGEYRDPSLPSEQVEPPSEESSFIRLDAAGLPIDREKQRDGYSLTPWRCLDDLRPLVRDNLYLRDQRFSYVYWLTPDESDMSSTKYSFSLSESDNQECSQETCHLETFLRLVNEQNYCARQDWRVPTKEEMDLLLHQEIKGGDYSFLYPNSFNSPESGLYWVKTASGYSVTELSGNTSVEVDLSEKNQDAKVLLIATEFEPRAEEDVRSRGNHGQPNFDKLRRDYSVQPHQWPGAFVDDFDNYQELGLMEKPVFPSHNPYSALKVELGNKLFFDPFLSKANDVSCSSCHDPKKGWADGLEVSIGHARQRGKRNAPTIVNSAFLPSLFWDGRAETLEQQSLMPIQDPLEMAESLPNLVDRLNQHDQYPTLFQHAFNESPITEQQVGMALATFQRTIINQPSRFDLFLEQISSNSDTSGLSDQELWGLDVYRRNGRCMNCHMGSELTNHQFENVGLTYYKAFYEDLGLYNVDQQAASVGKFKTPSLRDVMNTGPWFHNGLVSTMDGVISMYSEGMASNAPFGWGKYDPNYPQLSQKIRPLNLTYQEAEALKSFMKVITAQSPTTSIHPN